AGTPQYCPVFGNLAQPLPLPRAPAAAGLLPEAPACYNIARGQILPHFPQPFWQAVPRRRRRSCRGSEDAIATRIGSDRARREPRTDAGAPAARLEREDHV